jgi:hypothetical protein
MTTGQLDKFFKSLDGNYSPGKTDEPPKKIVPPKVAEDTAEILEIAKVISKSLEFNPRRLKQFLNVFRLQRFIAVHRGGLKTFVSDPGQGATVQQLGKFVAILLRWPGLLPDLITFPDLLAELQEAALRDERFSSMPETADEGWSKLKYWGTRLGFYELILACPQELSKGPTVPPDWELSSFDVKSYLNVATTFIPIDPREKKHEKGKTGRSS